MPGGLSLLVFPFFSLSAQPQMKEGLSYIVQTPCLLPSSRAAACTLTVSLPAGGGCVASDFVVRSLGGADDLSHAMGRPEYANVTCEFAGDALLVRSREFYPAGATSTHDFVPLDFNPGQAPAGRFVPLAAGLEHRDCAVSRLTRAGATERKRFRLPEDVSCSAFAHALARELSTRSEFKLRYVDLVAARAGAAVVRYNSPLKNALLLPFAFD